MHLVLTLFVAGFPTDRPSVGVGQAATVPPPPVEKVTAPPRWLALP